MKVNVIRLAILMGLLALSLPSAHATIIVDETFTYADGALVGKDPAVGGVWAAHSGAATNPFQVTSGTTAVNGTGEDVNIGFAGGPIGAGAIIYAGFDLTVPTSSVTTNANFAHFLQGTTIFGARVWMTAPSGGPGFRLALSGDNSITDADGESFWGSNLAFDTTYRVVTKYNYDTAETKLWISPVDESITLIAATDGFATDEFTAFALRQSLASSTQRIDNLIVATTFSEAAGIIPEPTTISLMLVSVGAMLFRRK
jgi:hypothetical protein